MRQEKFLADTLKDVYKEFPKSIQCGCLLGDYQCHLGNLMTVHDLIEKNALTNIRILDVGAGAGVVSITLKKKGFDVTVIDTWSEYADCYSNQMGNTQDILQRFRQNRIPCCVVDIEHSNLPFNDDTFDIVLFLAVIEHLHDSPRKILMEIRRVLKTKGYVVIATPNIAHIFNRLALLRGKTIHVSLDYWLYSDPFFGHVREYTLQEIKQMLKWTNLEVVIAKYVSHVGSLRSDKEQAKGFLNHSLEASKVCVRAFLFGLTILIPSLRPSFQIIGQKSEEWYKGDGQ